MPSGLQHFQISSVWDKGCSWFLWWWSMGAGEARRNSPGRNSPGNRLSSCRCPVGHRDPPALVCVLGQVGLTMGKDWPWGRTCRHFMVSLAVDASGVFALMWSLKETLCLPNLHCYMVPPLEGTQGSGTCGDRRNLNHWALASMDILCFA